jgi:hypothetical protein
MSSDPSPPGSSLVLEIFLLIIQTDYQRELFRKLGDKFVGIDATHNTTHYEKMSLYTLIVRDRWGHGE